MNKLSAYKPKRVVAYVVEGNSIRATLRMTGVAKATLSKFLVDLGRVCAKFHGETVRNVASNRIECDEASTSANEVLPGCGSRAS